MVALAWNWTTVTEQFVAGLAATVIAVFFAFILFLSEQRRRSDENAKSFRNIAHLLDEEMKLMEASGTEMGARKARGEPGLKPEDHLIATYGSTWDALKNSFAALAPDAKLVADVQFSYTFFGLARAGDSAAQIVAGFQVHQGRQALRTAVPDLEPLGDYHSEES
jgi:hypothetical protein